MCKINKCLVVSHSSSDHCSHYIIKQENKYQATLRDPSFGKEENMSLNK